MSNKFIFAGIGLLILGLFFIQPVLLYNSVETITIVVNDKERIVETTAEGTTSKYLVFTDKGPFEVTDSVAFFKWDASNRYNDLKKDETYTVEVAGWRIPFLSSYQNIIEIK